MKFDLNALRAKAAAVLSQSRIGVDLLEIEKVFGLSPEEAYLLREWARCGLPTIRPVPPLAAAIMATDFRGDVAGQLTMPWRCFLVVDEIGAALTGTSWMKAWPMLRSDHRIELQPMTSETIYQQIYIDDGPSIFRMAKSLTHMAGEPEPAVDKDESPLNEAKVARFNEMGIRTNWAGRDDHNSVWLLSRLVLGSVMELESSTGVHQTRGLKPFKRSRHGEPMEWAFQLTRNVRCDVRSALDSFLNGSRKSLNLQHMVRGHWKLQPFGPGKTERRRIHVEPYWRGPNDAPIAVRTHDLS